MEFWIFDKADAIDAMNTVIKNPCEDHVLISKKQLFTLNIVAFQPSNDEDNNKHQAKYMRKLISIRNGFAKQPIRTWDAR
jgi:hypothetical protein